MSRALPLTLVLLTSAEAADAVVAYLTDLGALDPQDPHALFLGRGYAAQIVVGLLYQIGQPVTGEEVLVPVVRRYSTVAGYRLILIWY